ncbi:hypothetical protein EIP91_002174 [Steccherinum ochraceum]|uniref:Uncharacterized protein n=1 Tax=Steccherinum ochraceum TaxID=92696 RepID=A0A4R0RTE6_9APHY|nr:hypothetical protein EIP91_002174 [Steccherinum ochraceum]
MKFATFVLSAAALYAASTVSVPIKRDVDPSLVPPFGLQSGINPDGSGNCDGIPGANGKPILIPCACPPAQAEFLQSLNANVAAGFVINNPSVKLSFPTDGSKSAQNARLNAAAVTLQNLHGPGKGCPVASTTFSAQQQAINAEPDNGTAPAPAPAPPAATKPAATASASPAPAPAPSQPAAADPPAVCSPAPVASSSPAASASAAPPPPAATPPANNAASSGKATPDQVAQLAPDLGFTAGKNPTGTGDCDGAVNDASGKPIKVPCACPPDRATFIAALRQDVAAGFAVNNPSVKIDFPTDNSKASQSARVEAAIVALQNLNGPGKGCPVVSTTLGAQQKALA